MIIDVNGRLMKAEEAKVSVYDHGFMYGIGLFETFRTYGGKPFLLTKHLERLNKGCREIGIVCKTAEDDWEKRIQALLRANKLVDAYFRISVSAGIDVLGLPEDEYKQPEEIIYVKPLPQTKPVQHKVLRKLHTLRNSPESLMRHKSFHFMNNVLAKRELANQPGSKGAEGLFLNSDGNICEGIVSNVFFVKNNMVHTPSVDTGCLPGITRQFVIQLASGAGIQVEEGRYDWNQLLSADEIFLTNSIQEIIPVTIVEDVYDAISVHFEKGPLTNELMKLYRKKAGE